MPRAKQVWPLSPLGFDFDQSQPTSFQYWFMRWFRKAPNKGLVLSCLILWHIWLDRNQEFWDHHKQHPLEVISTILVCWHTLHNEANLACTQLRDHDT